MTARDVGAGLDPTILDAVAVTEALRVDPGQGLAPSEAGHRLERDGPNELRSTPGPSLWSRVLAQFRDPLVYLLLVAIVISGVAWVAEGPEGMPVDAIVIAAIVVANAVLGFVQQTRAEDAVAALARLTAATSTVLRGEQLVSIPSAQLVRGDVLVLSEGDAVGADARLLESTGLRVQEASLTGESEASHKRADPLPRPAPLGDRRNMVYRGTAVVQGVGRAVVVDTGMDTEMGRIADLLERTEAAPSPLQSEIAAVSRSLGIIVVAIAVVVMVAIAWVNGVDTPQDLVTVLLMGLSLAVAAVPEGLPAILSLVLAIGVRGMARRNAVMKDLHSVETLGCASVICSDKTGTLTKNAMTLARVATASGEVEVTASGLRSPADAYAGEYAAAAPSQAALVEAQRVLISGSVANNAQLSGDHPDEWQVHGDPTEGAFLVAARRMGVAHTQIGDFHREAEVPFTSERKLMSVLVHHAPLDQRVLVTKGAPDVLLPRCTAVLVGGSEVPMDDMRRRRATEAFEALSGHGFRTLAVAERWIADDEPAYPNDLEATGEEELTYLGVVGIIDPPREEVPAAIAQARRAGVRTIMITGDHPVTAAEIASRLGITTPGSPAVTGEQLDALDDAQLRELVQQVSVYARVAPEHKLRIVDTLQADRHVVAMTGDGVNDAPALKSADIGVAMGIAGTEVTKDAGKMILGDDNYATIVAAIRAGRVIYDNIEKFLRYLLSSNMGEVATVFFGVVFAGLLGLSEAAGAGTVVVPLLATQILWINLVTDSAPALAMGVDPEIDDVMARPPRAADKRILDRAMWWQVIVVGLGMAAVTLLSIDVFLPGGLVKGTDSVETARTVGFTTLVLAQLFNALSSRSDRLSAFHQFFANWWLLGALALGAALQVLVVQVPYLQRAFGTQPLDLTHWAVAVGLASLVMWGQEVAKLLRRSR